MKRAICLLTALGLLLTVAAPVAGQVSREQIESAIDSGVQALVASQADDGHWPYAREAGYSVGHTALAVLALQHARSKRADAQLALKKGMTFILQNPPEARTYSSGLVLQSLYFDKPKKNRKLIAAYAWMLCGGQKLVKPSTGSWNYRLPSPRENWAVLGLGPFGSPPQGRRTDNSNSQFGILGLVYAQKAGFQIPRIVWERAHDYYTRIQHDDGSWDYQSDAFRAAVPKAEPRRRDSMSMTLVGTVSIYLIDEMLADKSHRQCVARPPNQAHENGLKWIAKNWTSSQSPYGWYATERLGLLIGYSEFGGHDWYQEGASNLLRRGGGSSVSNTAFKVLFLSRGRNPIIINKLKREGDWNLHRYDLKNLIEHISGPWQHPSQWRIITLDASVDLMLKVPILWISGHNRLKFTDEEKQKLKEYVERGGTILGEACCGKKAFDISFRELLKELWPDTKLRPLPKTHGIYTSFRRLAKKPTLMGLPLEKGQGRLGVIYIPYGMSCKWEVGGSGARPWLDVGACIYLYIDQMNRRMSAKNAEASLPGGVR